MSRIQDILSKAERDGTARRTRALSDEYPPRPAAGGEEPRAARSLSEEPRAARALSEEPRDARSLSDGPRGAALDATVHARGFVDAPAARRAEPTGPPRGPSIGDASARVPQNSRQARALRTEGSSAVAPAVAARTRTAETGPVLVEPEAPSGARVGRAPAHETVDARARDGVELDHHLIAALAPASLAAEQYRSLRTRLKQAEQGRALRVVAITSPAKGDGKSLTAANLALTMAQEYQQRVLLVDADLRRPNVHRLFGLSESPGLVDVLLNDAELDHSLVSLPDHHLTILPAGLPPAHPAELLGSAAMRRLLDTLRTRFDRILIDVPPVAPLADLHILTPMLDGLLMIVRAGVTPKPAIERALSGLDASKVLGLVLNEAGTEGAEVYNYEGYGYIAG
jgi:capsular exopolysaccharide synthesis family protein